MRPALSLKLSQSLTLTPQLKQALKLLTLSALELQSELAEMVAENPLLEMEEGENEPVQAAAEIPGPGSSAADSSSADATEASNATTETALAEVGEQTETYDADFDLERLDRLPESGVAGSHTNNDDDEGRETRPVEAPDLRESLHWQLELHGLSPRDMAIAEAILDALESDGYLRADNDDLRAAVAPEILAADDEIEAVRHCIQQMDPTGIASRNLSECLDVQLELLAGRCPELAQAIVRNHLELLGRGDREKLAKLTTSTLDEIDAAIKLIRRMNPKPGAGINPQPVEYVVPDVFVVRRGGRFEVHRNAEAAPQLRLSGFYRDLIGTARRDDRSYLRGRLQEARWLIRSLEQREESVLKVAKAIVEQQQAFFEFGPERMRPLVMREVADQVELHESTISRVTTRKYMHTPRGIYEFKHFFSSGVATKNGEGAAANAIQAMIKKLIDEEPPRKPLSDSALTEMLRSRGVMVARRTVAKYREGMGIANSNERVRL
jgi:RNA polymerase sigma-54 factor